MYYSQSPCAEINIDLKALNFFENKIFDTQGDKAFFRGRNSAILNNGNLEDFNLAGPDDCALRFASRNGDLELVKCLVSVGSNIHSQDDYALIWASRNNNFEVVKYLVLEGAYIHAQDDCAHGYR